MAGFPAGSGIAMGKMLASLSSTPSNSRPSNGRKVANPRRFQWNRSWRGQGNPRAVGRERRVRHDVALDVFAKTDPWIFTTPPPGRSS